MDHTPVSVIIPTYNGAHKISFLIKALEHQTFKEFEVLVVVDGSTDNTLEVLNSIKPIFSSFKVISQENKGRAAVRNTGVKNASGDLLIFFDDDMLPVENCIEAHVAHHEKYPNSILTGGLIEEVNGQSPEILKFKSFLSGKWNRELRTNNEGELSKTSIFVAAANLSLAKNVFNQLGGFDERLSDAEDFDLAVRAHIENIPLFFNKQVFAWHNDIITCASYIKRTRQYAEAHKRLVKLKPWMADKEYIKPAEQPVGWRKKVFRFFASPFWINAVDKEKLKFLPKKLRFKIYDVIITANGIYFTDRVAIK